MRQFKQLKEGPISKEGAIFTDQEGNSFYICDDQSKLKLGGGGTEGLRIKKRVIEEQPDWFKEVYPVFLEDDQVEKVEKLLGLKISPDSKFMQ